MTQVHDARVDQLTALVEQLQAEVAQLKAQREDASVERAGDADAPLDRRRMLKGAGLAAAAGAAALVVTGRATPAGAINPTLTLDQSNNIIANTTLTWTGSAGAARCLFLVNDTELAPSSSTFECAIGGWAGGNTGATTTVGVYGYSETGGGEGVIGMGDTGVHGQSYFGSAGMHAEGMTGPARGLVAQAHGTGQALWAQIDNVSNTKDSVRAETSGTGSGIYATSANGAGGKFAGKTANITLVPSTASSHPASGSAGQLFVDASKRLWFCKGGTDWHQLV
jgi:hypothetical protein